MRMTLFAAAVAIAPVAGPAMADVVDPMVAAARYDGPIVFDVRRNGDSVGEHTVTFRQDGDDLIAETTFDIAIRFAFITVYRYSHRSTEVWRDGQLQALTAWTDDDGEVGQVEIARDGDVIAVRYPDGSDATAAHLFPTTHWNASVLGADRVFNTLTGNANKVEIVPGPMETIVTGAGEREARRYAYTGQLQNEVWYDDAGRWVKMRFTAKGGSVIEYECRRCGGTP